MAASRKHIFIELFCISSDGFADYFSDYECNQPLMERAVLTATSSLTDRDPEKARLNGEISFLFKNKTFYFLEFIFKVS